MERNTWLPAPNFDLPADGRFRLGAILADRFDVNSVIYAGPPSMNEYVKHSEVKNVTSTYETKKGSSGLLGVFLQSVLGATTTYAPRNSKTTLTAGRMETQSFDPSIEDIRKYTADDAVQRFLATRIFPRPVYLVTGLRIIHGANLAIEDESRSNVALGITVPAGGISVSGGAEVLGGHGVGGSISRHTVVSESRSTSYASDFIVAYRLHKIRIQKSKVKVDPLPGTGFAFEEAEEEEPSESFEGELSEDSEEEEEPSEDFGGEPSRRGGSEGEPPERFKGKLPESGGSESKEEEGGPPEPLASEAEATNEPRPLRILCLDGGGVRGLSSLIILREIMKEVQEQRKQAIIGGNSSSRNDDGAGVNDEKEEDKLRPCDYFDLICGTSTGGLIAIMLGRLQYTVDDCIAKYQEMSRTVFGNPIKRWRSKVKYDAGELERCVRGVIAESPFIKSLRESNHNFPGDYDPDLDDQSFAGCRTFVTSTLAMGRDDQQGSIPVLLRSYKGYGDGQPPISCKIWEAARATSAAPSIFDSIQIKGSTLRGPEPSTSSAPKGGGGGGTSGETDGKINDLETQTLLDGGLVANNPTLNAIMELRNIWPSASSTGLSRNIACIVSIGTGTEGTVKLNKGRDFINYLVHFFSPFNNNLLDLAKYMKDITLSCEKTHLAVKTLVKVPDGDFHKRYFRFNASKVVGEIELDEWNKLRTIERETLNWLIRDQDAHADKQKVAQILYNPNYESDQQLQLEWAWANKVPQEDMAIPLYTKPSTGRILRIPPPMPGTQSEIPWTWPARNEHIPCVHSMVFYTYSNKDGMTKDEKVLADRLHRDGESAVCILELTSNANFVSSAFVERWKLKEQPLDGVWKDQTFVINGKSVTPSGLVPLRLRCHALGIKMKDTWFRVLKSDEFEVLFGCGIVQPGLLQRTEEQEGGQEGGMQAGG